MKYLSILLTGILFLVSCAKKPLPRQVYANMPMLVVDEKKVAQKMKRQKSGLTQNQKWALAAGAAILAYAGYKALSQGDNKCGDCLADGFVQRGDPGYSLLVTEAHVCRRCNGRGFH